MKNLIRYSSIGFKIILSGMVLIVFVQCKNSSEYVIDVKEGVKATHTFMENSELEIYWLNVDFELVELDVYSAENITTYMVVDKRNPIIVEIHRALYDDESGIMTIYSEEFQNGKRILEAICEGVLYMEGDQLVYEISSEWQEGFGYTTIVFIEARRPYITA